MNFYMRTKKFTAILLSVLMIVQMFCVSAAAESTSEVLTSGICGDNLTWTLDEDGVLTISGTGEMESRSYLGDYIWLPETVTSVVINEGVTSIGDNAFENCTNLTSVSLPESLESIGFRAFCGCTKLTSVIIPDNVSAIDNCAFMDCTALESVQLPTKLTEMEYGLFSGCSSLLSVDIPSGITAISGSVFSNCNMLKSVVIPEGVTTIGEEVFVDCDSLESLTIPSTVETIGHHFACICDSLRFVVFKGDLPTIGIVPFSSSEILTIYYYKGTTGWDTSGFNQFQTVMLDANDNPITGNSSSGICGENATWTLDENGVLTISGTGAIDEYPTGLYPWGNYEILENGYSYGSNSSVNQLIIEEGITSIPRGAFSSCNEVVSVELPDSLETIGNHTFFFSSSFMNTLHIPQNVSSIGDGAFGALGNAEITVDENNQYYYVESNCLIARATGTIIRGSKGCKIPEDASVTRIGYEAFDYMDFGRTIVIPENIEYIDNAAFNANTSEYVLFMGDVFTEWNSEGGPYTFDSDNTLLYFRDKSGWTSPEWTPVKGSVTYNTMAVDGVIDGFVYKIIDDQTVEVVTYIGSDTSVVIPSEILGYTVSSLADNAFYRYRDLTSITIPDSVTSIGDYAFYGCNSLASITIPNNITSIGDCVFASCDSLATITIPNNVTSIGDRAFYGCNSLATITIPNSVTSIGDYAFYGCNSLASITIPNNITSIGDCVFASCDSLATITIPNNVTSIGDRAFYGCNSLATITIPNSVTSIGEFAFYGCKTLTQAVFDGNVPEFGNSVFGSQASNFTIYYYEGTSDWTSPTWTDFYGNDYKTLMLASGETPPVPPNPDKPSDPNRYIPQEDDPSTILFDVPYAETEWKADGIISEGEYQKMDIKSSQLSYAASNGNMMDVALQTPVELYMSYDDNYVYIAATTPADNYVCEIDDSNAYNMWAAHAVQLSLANINATDSAKRLETGYALSSLDNKLYSNTWFDPMGIHYDPEENVDYNVVNNGSTLVYEIRVPFEAFDKEKLTEGDSFLGSLAWAVGPTTNGGADAYAHIQLGYGLSGDPGKDPAGHATFTLAERPHTHEDADGKWEYDGTNHWHTCTCGEVMDSASHSGGTATCASRAKCSVCGTAYGSYSAFNHTSQVTVNTKAATEFETGYSGDIYCRACGTTTAYGSVTPATHVHTLEAVEAAAATCVAVGNEAYYRCTNTECGKLFADADGKTALTAVPELAIDETKHGKLDVVGAKDATETEEGYTGDTVCEDCKATVTVGTVIEKRKPAPVPVDVPVEAVVSGSTVTVESIDESILNIGTDSGEEPEEGEAPAEPAPASVVSIDLTVYETEDEKITEAALPAEVIETITEVVEDPENTVEGIAIHLSTGSMQLDDKTVRAMVEQSEGDTVRLVMDDKTDEALNTLQEEALKELEIHGKVDVYMECEQTGKRISDFNGGTVTLQIPFEIPENCHSKGFTVWYVDEDGSRTPMNTRYENGMIVWDVTHFSDYVIIYEEPAAEDMDNPYTDISEDAWYYGDVLYTYANGLMVGVGDDRFAPETNLTRAMFVTVLWRMAGAPAVTEDILFEDVPADTWYTEAVRWAASEGLVNGYSETAFGPDDTITREQLAAILYRYEQMSGGGFTGTWMFLPDFSDTAEISEWAYEAMCFMNMNGIVNGKPEKLLDPKGNATRAEAAAMLARYHKMKSAEQTEG